MHSEELLLLRQQRNGDCAVMNHWSEMTFAAVYKLTLVNAVITLACPKLHLLLPY